MADINKSYFTGRIGTDIELKTTTSGTSVCTFRLAVERLKAKDAEKAETDWLNMVAWRSTAEFCSRYLSKGRKVFVECATRTRRWEDKEHKKHSVVEYFIDNIVPADAKQQNQAVSHTETTPEFTEIGSDEDLPF